MEAVHGGNVQRQSFRGGYVHRPDARERVTAWGTGAGSLCTIEAVAE